MKEFKGEYFPRVDQMTEWFDENLGPNDGYLIYEDLYQIELCFRYYYPDLKKYDWDSIDQIKGNIWYFEVPGYEDYLELCEEHGYGKIFIDDMNFDRYNFRLYKLEKL